MNNIPRRNRLDLCKPAELAIYTAVGQVEQMGASPALTNAIVKLNEARDLVADFVDQSLKTWRDIESYEDAVEMRPVDEDDIIYPTDRPHIVAFKQLCHITKVVNGNFEADFNNSDQKKWYQVFHGSGSGFGFSTCFYHTINFKMNCYFFS